jgi:uncharacterized protein (TIGR03067 family)
MTHPLNLFPLLLAFGLGAPALKERPKPPPTLIGEWDVVSIAMSGFPATTHDPGELTYTARADKSFHVNDQRPGTFGIRQYDLVIDLEKTPWRIDLNPPAGAIQNQFTGIFKIDGDVATLCLTTGTERPTTFEGKEDSEQVIVMKRKTK